MHRSSRAKTWISTHWRRHETWCDTPPPTQTHTTHTPPQTASDSLCHAEHKREHIAEYEAAEHTPEHGTGDPDNSLGASGPAKVHPGSLAPVEVPDLEAHHATNGHVSTDAMNLDVPGVPDAVNCGMNRDGADLFAAQVLDLVRQPIPPGFKLYVSHGSCTESVCRMHKCAR